MTRPDRSPRSAENGEPASGGYPPGTVLDPVPERDEPELQNRMRSTLKRQAGGASDVVWHDADAEAIFHTQLTRVRVIDGVVLVGIQLETIETGPSSVAVPFAVGLRNRLTGMLMTSERKPRGQPLLVDRWGDSAIAVAYGALVEAANDIAGLQGRDQDNAPLIAGAVFAEPSQLFVIPQARHPGERAVRQ